MFRSILINETVLNEVKQNRRNLVTVWLDYQKAFDSVPQEWLIESLKVAKLPPLIIAAIDTLTKTWATKAYIIREKYEIRSTKYKNGIAIYFDVEPNIFHVKQIKMLFNWKREQ